MSMNSDYPQWHEQDPDSIHCSNKKTSKEPLDDAEAEELPVDTARAYLKDICSALLQKRTLLGEGITDDEKRQIEYLKAEKDSLIATVKGAPYDYEKVKKLARMISGMKRKMDDKHTRMLSAHISPKPYKEMANDFAFDVQLLLKIKEREYKEDLTTSKD